MAKRFTDSNKWRNEWFRTLPMKAKLMWSYLCDECDYVGIWKADYGLASFQLDFKVSKNDLTEWFGKKVYFLGNDTIFIVPFFEFQYGETRDTWNAKIKAKEKIESLGFKILNNKVEIPQTGDSPPTVHPQSYDCLSIDKGIGIGIFNKERVQKKSVKITTPEELVEAIGSEGIEKLLQMFPQHLVDREFPYMAIWLRSEPPKKDYLRFATNWLKKSLEEHERKNKPIANTMGVKNS